MTKEIQLTQGKVAIVDDEDYTLVSQYKWCALKYGYTYYAVRGVGSKMHRLLLGAQHGQIVDHIDHDGLNNTRANIRIVTSAQSNRNKRKYKSSASEYKGVTPNKKNGRWKMVIATEFATEIEAARTYDRVMRYLDVKHAYLNFDDYQQEQPPCTPSLSPSPDRFSRPPP